MDLGEPLVGHLAVQLERVRQMAETLLANPVIEDFTVTAADAEPEGEA